MKQTVNFSDFVDAFKAYDRYDQFGYQALMIVFEYLEELEESTGEELELDVVSICCDYATDNWHDIAVNYSIEIDENENEDEQKQQVIDYLNENTVVLGETDCEIVYQIF
jgi:predicted solute-binding protein